MPIAEQNQEALYQMVDYINELEARCARQPITQLKEHILDIINSLDEKDVEGHIWWNRFLTLIDQYK